MHERGFRMCSEQTVGIALGLLIALLYTVGGVAVQALDKLVPLFQLNVCRLVGKRDIQCSNT